MKGRCERCRLASRSIPIGRGDTMSSTTELASLRRLARRRGLRRALFVLVFLPVGIALLIIGTLAAWFPETFGLSGGIFDAVLVWPLRILGSFVALFLIVSFIFGTLGDLRGALGDPIVVRGKVVEKTEWTTGDNLMALIVQSLFGHDLVVDIQRAIRIGPGGSTSEDRDFLGSKRDVSTTRRVHHGVAAEQEVFLVCTSTGRAVATLSDLRDAGATEEIMGVLRTDVAPQAES
jgi:hypothetical protein